MMGFGSVFSTQLDFTMRSASGVPERESVGECDESSVSVGGSGLREGFSRRPKDAERTSMPITPPLGLSMSPARARWPKVIRSLVGSGAAVLLPTTSRRPAGGFELPALFERSGQATSTEPHTGKKCVFPIAVCFVFF